MARRKFQSRLARYWHEETIDIVRLTVVSGQHVDTPIFTGLEALVRQDVEQIITGDLTSTTVETWIFTIEDSTLDIKADDVIIFNTDRYQVIDRLIQGAAKKIMDIIAERIDS